MPKLSNFECLKKHDPVFFQLAFAAEQSFSADPNTTLIKLRQLGEALAQDMAARCNVDFDEKTAQADLLFKLNREIRLDANIRELFHTLRIEGNKASHQFKTRHREAINALQLARTLAIWFHRAFGQPDASFKPGPFIAPTDPSLPLRELNTQIEQLKAKLLDANGQVENNQQLMALVAREKEEYATLAEHMDAEARTFKQQALIHENQLKEERKAFDARLKALQIELENRSSVPQQLTTAIQKATSELTLNEALTRILIDQQLISAGWQADTEQLTYQKGTRPEKGKNKAIAEWPTQGNQAADYVLFAGLTPIAVVEAKRENINVAGKIPQAERYSKGFKQGASLFPAWQLQGRTIAWADNSQDLVWARQVIEHSIFPLFTLEGFSRVLRPGGFLYLEVPAPETACHHERNPKYYSVFPKGCWRALLERCGFWIVGDVDFSFEVPAGPDLYWGFYCRKN